MDWAECYVANYEHKILGDSEFHILFRPVHVMPVWQGP